MEILQDLSLSKIHRKSHAVSSVVRQEGQFLPLEAPANRRVNFVIQAGKKLVSALLSSIENSIWVQMIERQKWMAKY